VSGFGEYQTFGAAGSLRRVRHTWMALRRAGNRFRVWARRVEGSGGYVGGGRWGKTSDPHRVLELVRNSRTSLRVADGFRAHVQIALE
jgi:hypothetical protein